MQSKDVRSLLHEIDSKKILTRYTRLDKVDDNKGHRVDKVDDYRGHRVYIL